MEPPNRQQIAGATYRFIVDEVRPFLDGGGRLWTKGSQGYPRRLRQMLQPLDRAHVITYATHDAMLIDESERVVEHVIPMKRIVIEIVDPSQADPRSNTTLAPIGGGPALSPNELIAIFDRLLVKCWVTSEQHDRLNRAGRSFQWDAPDGDGWARYRQAGVTVIPVLGIGEIPPDD